MSRKTLSPFSFFGGKARLAHEIADMLDYQHTDIYVEPFGGACRVLLNKPRHDKEIYNDLGTSLVTFFKTLSDRKTADEVIRKLNDMEISEDVFIEQQNYKNEVEMDTDGYITKQALAAIRECRKKVKGNGTVFQQARKALNGREYSYIVACLDELIKIINNRADRERIEEYRDLFSQYWEFIKKEYSDNYAHQVMYMIDNGKLDIFSNNSRKQRRKYFTGLINADLKNKKKSKLETGGNRFDSERQNLIDEFLKKTEGIEKLIELSKNKGWHEKIHKAVLDELPDNSKYLDEYDNVKLAVATFYTYTLSRDGMGIVYSSTKENDSEAYYRRIRGLDDIAERLDGVEFIEMDAFLIVDMYRKYSNVMMYLDPSYLNDDKEDLGKDTYAASSSYNDHKELLKILLRRDTKAKIVISNYDVELYNSKLTEKNGWKKIEIETFTSVGSKKDNKRTEVLWYNY